MEGRPQPGQGRVVEAVEGDRHVEFVVLPQIAHLDRAVDRDVPAVALALERGDSLADQVGEHPVGVLPVERRRRHLGRPFQVDARVGHQEAEGGELPRMVRHDAARDVGVRHQIGGVHRARAAEREQREVARVEAALGQHRAQRADHVVVGDPHHGEGGLFDRLVDRRCDRGHRCRRGVLVQVHGAAEEVPRVDAADDDVRVRHRGPTSAQAVAGRAGRRAGALGADAQHPALVDPGE